jgi:type II secretory pathway component PulF
MVYPIVLGSVAIGVVIFLLTFVVPRLSLVFRDMKDTLPLSTKILLGTTAVLTQNYLLILASVAGAYILYRGWVLSESGALMRDRMLLRFPIVGKVVTKAVISRYARTLSTLVFGGVPILEALRLSGLAAGNRVFQRTSDIVADEVREGKSIHQAMQDTAVFPPVLTHMVAIGEETGDLPKMLNRVSDSLDFEVDNGMRKLMSMLEPIIVLVMGAFVAFVVISILLPIFMAQEAVK